MRGLRSAYRSEIVRRDHKQGQARYHSIRKVSSSRLLTKKLRGLSPRANYAGREAGRLSAKLVPTFVLPVVLYGHETLFLILTDGMNSE
jgi:hypothetical protein